METTTAKLFEVAERIVIVSLFLYIGIKAKSLTILGFAALLFVFFLLCWGKYCMDELGFEVKQKEGWINALKYYAICILMGLVVSLMCINFVEIIRVVVRNGQF